MSKHSPEIGHPDTMDWVNTSQGRTLRISIDFPGEDRLLDISLSNAKKLGAFIVGEVAPDTLEARLFELAMLGEVMTNAEKSERISRAQRAIAKAKGGTA